MKIRYFQETDTLYIEFRAGEVAETKDLDENTLLDVDPEGNICGGAFPFSGSNWQSRKMRIGHVFQDVPSPGLIIGPQHQHFRGIFSMPEDTRPFQA